MDDPDQSPLVSSSTATAAEQDRWQPPQKPLFQYQFVRDPEEEEEDEEEEEEEEEVDDERLEVRERKPAAPAAGPAPSLLDLGASGERPPVPPQPAWTSHPFTSSSSPPLAAATESPPPEEKPKEPPRSAPQPPPPPPRDEPPAIPPRSAPPPPKREEPPAPTSKTTASGSPVVDLLYWRDVKKTGVVFGASLFLLLSLTVFSIVSVVAYIALGLLSVTISLRIYKGVIQAIQKSDDGHPFRAYLDKDVAVSEELVQKYSHVVLGHFNNTIKELRRLFLVDDLVDSLKFAVLMWVFTYVGALFNGLTLMILAVISLFSIPIIYEKHQVQIDHYLGLVNKNVKEAVTKIQDKIPGLKRKTE
ncbi:reticulon-4 isoform X4 [Sphaerodactylus townsendi]|uniref:reticulon-4 isoform X4 n=1 Tax=Sphaerodactylus townsendi TaxID=933632 RepID=UPI002026C51D|nr:reticulon-4 isoform X4 [Sphaerodactylus townsendi]